MKNTKLIITLGKVNPKELQSFQSWLASPFFNKNRIAEQAFKYILKYTPQFHKLEKRKLFGYLYPKEAYNDLKVNNIISNLTRQLFDFLAYQNFKGSNNLPHTCLIDELLKRDLDKLMLQENKRLTKEKLKSTIQNPSSFFEDYLQYKLLDEHFLKQPKRAYDENLQLKNDSLDLFYLSTKLKIACDMISRNTVIQANYQITHFQDLMQWIENEQNDYLSYPALSVYFQALKTIQHGKVEDYYSLKSLLERHLSVFPNTEITKLYDYILNFCIRQINQGNANFYKEILDVYKFLLEKRIIYINGHLAQWDYKNIITVGARLEEVEWTEHFIHQYKDELPPDVRENAFVYNLASFYYSIKAYKKSLQRLYEVKFTDTSYHLGAKIIQLKSFYELNETEPFYALIDSFRIYILRSKDISTYRKQSNLNLVKFANRIFKLKQDKDLISPSIYKSKWKKIIEKLEKTENVANKGWLSSCLKELEMI